MSATEAQLQAEDVIDNVSLPLGKRKAEDSDQGSESANKVAKVDDGSSPAGETAPRPLPDVLQVNKGLPVKARENRLEQNRKAARESRRRKKVMIEELQRSVIFFSRANGALKQQNDELTRLLMQAQMHVAQHNKNEEDKANGVGEEPPEEADVEAEKKVEESRAAEEKRAASDEQKRADTVATQAIFESQGFPAAAARAAAQAVNGSLDKPPAASPTTTNTNLPAMQPGATMQAMANFQQAAAAAMQQAMGQMKGVPGLTQMAATPVGSNPQHAFTDAMTAIAMQQAAAAAAANQQFIMQNNMQLLPAVVNQIPQAQPPAAPAENKEEAPVVTAAAVAAAAATPIPIAPAPEATNPEAATVAAACLETTD